MTRHEMMNENVRKNWLKELRKEEEELEKNWKALKLKVPILEERVKVLEYARRWHRETNKTGIIEEAEKEVEETKKKLEDAKTIKEKKGTRLVFIRSLIDYIENIYQ